MKNNDEKWHVLSKEKKLISSETMNDVYLEAVGNLGRLNRNAAELMLKHGVTSSTDVTGFGILGHA